MAEDAAAEDVLEEVVVVEDAAAEDVVVEVEDVLEDELDKLVVDTDDDGQVTVEPTGLRLRSISAPDTE